MKITGETTLTMLDVELAKMGVTFLSVKSFECGKYIAGCMCPATTDWVVSPECESVAEAIEEAIDIVRHHEAARITLSRSQAILDQHKE